MSLIDNSKYSAFHRIAGKYFSSKLPNPLIADDNFLLELPYAISLCKGFKRLATFGNPAWARGKPLLYKNLF